MRRSIVSLAAGLGAFLVGYSVLPAADVPDAFSTEGPALASFNNLAMIAWADDAGTPAHKVSYSTFKGTWMAPVEVPGALTTAAPALGAAGQRLYLATTPPDSGHAIHLYESSDGTNFHAIDPLCHAKACASTEAAPALVGGGEMLHAAWTTSTGAVMYATFSNGAWSAAAPVPNAQTDPKTGPALTLYQNQLYLAWLEPSGAVSIASATLPLSKASWHEPIRIPAQAKVAPALGVLTIPNPVPGSAAARIRALFLAWTKADSTIQFSRWDGAAQWTPAPAPISLPTGPLTSLPVTMYGFNYESANHECFAANTIGYTGYGPHHRHKVVARQVTTGCPPPHG
jgi:hypothetical protein